MAACIAHDGEPGGSDRGHDAVATVLIIGASRGIGLEAVKAALEAGHSVRALARSARRIPIDHPKLEKMAGDALEMATVKRALTGVDVVTPSLAVSAGPEIGRRRHLDRRRIARNQRLIDHSVRLRKELKSRARQRWYGPSREAPSGVLHF